MTEDRVFELLEEADDLEPGVTQLSLYEEAARLTDELEWEDLAFQIRKRIMHSAVFSGSADRLMVAFSWCLGKVDEDPEEFDEVELFWEFKWAISSACRFPQISLDQIRRMLDDYATRLKRNNFSLRPAVYLDMCLAMTVGDMEKATALSREWPQLPRDDFADCEACELDQIVELRVLQHRDQQAIDLAAPLLAEELTCAEVPHRTLALLLEPAMRLGQMDFAGKLHRRGYPMIAGDADFLPQLGKHAIYLARVGEFARGLELLERHFDWAHSTREQGDRLDFLIGALALMRAFPEPIAPIRVPCTHPLHKRGESQQTQALRDWCEQEVFTLCRSFDERNGNGWQTELAQSWLALGGRPS